MVVELDLRGKLLIVPVLLNVKALVDVVGAAMHPVDFETVETVVGVLDVDYAAVAINGRVALEDGVVLIALALDSDVGVGFPRG